jgi:hypothetical protein
LKGIAFAKEIAPRSGMGVDAEIGAFLLPQIAQAMEQDAVFEDIRGVSRVKGMTVTEHLAMIARPFRGNKTPVPAICPSIPQNRGRRRIIIVILV